MKKFFLILGILFFSNLVMAADTPYLTGSVDFDWVNMSQVQRDETIGNYQNLLFGENNEKVYSRRDFKTKYKQFLKDENFKLNYVLLKNDVKETTDAEFCTFYHKNLLYMYAIKYKNHPDKVYYYNGLGSLTYVDEMSETFPDFPYYSKQFRSNGTLAGAIYFVSKDLQYVYKPDGSFKGVWFKDKMFNSSGKLILTRTNW